MSDTDSINNSPLETVRQAIDHLNHVLPGQGPILDFIHHNTIHGFQHLPFSQALEDYEKLTGTRGYMTETRFRECFNKGRISEKDLNQAIDSNASLRPGEVLLSSDKSEMKIENRDIYLAALRAPVCAISTAQLRWQLTREKALNEWQTDIPADAKASLSEGNENARTTLPALWQHIQSTLAIARLDQDPDSLSPLPLTDSQTITDIASSNTRTLLAEVGNSLSLGGLVFSLSGQDIRNSVFPVMMRLSASMLDEGIAPWHAGDNHYHSLYQAWRDSLHQDCGLTLEALAWQDIIAQLPDSAEETIIQQLEKLQLPPAKWAGYLQRLCLEVPGWTGLINWRQQNPDYHCLNSLQPHLADWLAIRLILDKLYLDQLCRQLWQCDGNYSALSAHLTRHSLECWVRTAWQQGKLPETLSQQTDKLDQQQNAEESHWLALANSLHSWQQNHDGDAACTAHDQGWKLFRLCQHLGLGKNALPILSKEVLTAMLQTLDEFSPDIRNRVWLLDYEIHYRNDLFKGIAGNFRRGNWVNRNKRPHAQIVMCMDEREESFRRHLEELNPRIETLGAAGFFGIPMKFKGLDDTHLTSLCPIVVTPAHRVDEKARAAQDQQLKSHRKGAVFLQRFTYKLHQSFRLNPLYNWFGTFLLAPFSLVGQLMHSLFPAQYKAIVDSVRRYIVTPVTTELTITTDSPDTEASTENPRLGFTDQEQAEKVGALLRTLGLTANFAPLVAFSGHGSTSQNNPHEAAHDCGACGGRQGGPNARAYAGMANRAEVRSILAAGGIHIPDDSWFLGMQHDTCNDSIIWYDTDLIPADLQDKFQTFRKNIEQAQEYSAHERCRRFYSANDPATTAKASQHVTLRARDLSQVRPEYGHATNASAIIGRRNISQGLFLDRRSFLISYDPTQDPEGNILENILLTAGPVGAGINLEYYFSTIDNNKFGCGTKIPHNVAGLFGVMEGTGSDLRTGLPEQMIEIHEAMRLLVVVEHKTSVLERIYGDQPALQELVGGGWLLLATKDPDSEAIHMFEPDQGFVAWQDDDLPLPECAKSMDCYNGIHAPISPILITQPEGAQ